MNAVASSPEKEARLQQRMAALGVRESDLAETFVRSAGHGGQNVNKTSTCVVLCHRPSGIQVRCQTTRQQGQNRVLARWRLIEKLEAIRQVGRRPSAPGSRKRAVRTPTQPGSQGAHAGGEITSGAQKSVAPARGDGVSMQDESTDTMRLWLSREGTYAG